MSEKPIRRVLTREQFNDMLRDAPPPTSDDVTLTNDGRRLDSVEAVTEFFAKLDAALAEQSAGGRPDDHRCGQVFRLIDFAFLRS